MSDAVLSARMVRSVRGIFVFMVLGLCAEVVSRRSGRDFFRAPEKRIFIERQTVRMGGKNVEISGNAIVVTRLDPGVFCFRWNREAS